MQTNALLLFNSSRGILIATLKRKRLTITLQINVFLFALLEKVKKRSAAQSGKGYML